MLRHRRCCSPRRCAARCRRTPDASPCRAARGPAPDAYQRQRRRGLPRHPAAGHPRALQRCAELAALPGHRRDRPALLRPARHVPRPRCTRRPGLTGRADPKYFKDSSFGVARRPGRAHLLAARRRHDRARQGRSACRTSTARRATARCSGSATRPPRTGCSSWTCCATPAAASCRASPAARTRRWTPSSGRSRPTPRPTSSARPTSCREFLGAQGAQIAARRRQLHRRHQPVHRRGQARPDEDAGRVRRDRPPAGAGAVEARPT